jgi:hypothetical protein
VVQRSWGPEVLWSAVLGSVVLGSSLIAQVPAPAPAAPTGLIVGRVIDAESRAPIPGALVQLAGEATSPQPPNAPRGVRALADAEGRFAFRQLAAGRYTITVTTGGNGFEPAGFIITGIGHPVAPYLNGGYGQRRPEGPVSTLTLEEGGVVPDAVVRLWKPGGIDGLVLDESGEVLVGTVVSAVRRRGDGSLGTGPTTRTDDRGAFHFGTLAPGNYVVVVPQTQVLLPGDLTDADPLALRRLAAAGAPAPNATPSVSNSLPAVVRDGRRHVYRSTFHPGVTRLADAQTIAVRSGDIVANVTVALTPVPASSITGVLMDAGVPVPGFGLRLQPADEGDGADVLELAWTATDAEGRFVFPDVPAGNYRIEGQRRTGVPSSVTPEGRVTYATPSATFDRSGAWTRAAVTIGDRPLTGVSLTMNAPLAVRGKFTFAGTTPAPAQESMQRFVVMPMPARTTRREVSGSGTAAFSAAGFSSTDLAPGPYRFMISDATPGWALQSVTIAGQDVTDAVFLLSDRDVTDVQVTFTDQPADISGVVSGEHAGASVFMFPADRSRWRDAANATRTVRAVRPDAQGRFQIPKVIPGDYLVIAAIDDFAHAWPEEGWLLRASGLASSVRVTPGQRQVVTLKPVSVK